MGLVNVPGLGVVEIAGDAPTEAEDLEMQQLLAERQPAPTAAPPTDAPSPTIRESVSRLPAAVQEPLAPLVGLHEGFAAMGDPRSERPWYEQAVRGPAARMSKLVRGAALETPLAIAEGVFGLEEAGIPAGMTAAEAVASPDVEISPSAALNQYWQEWEGDLYRPSEPVPSEAWAAVADDPSRLGKFLLEGVTSTLPDYAATLVAGPVRYAAAIMGDMAKGRAAERGDNRVNATDVLVALPAAAAISGLNTAAQKFGLSGAAVHGIMRTAARSALAETVTELPQTWIETVARQAGARPGGVSGEALKEGTIAAATIAPLAGGLAGPVGATFTRAGRALAETPAARSERVVAAEVDRLRAEAQEAAPVAEEVAPEAPPVVAEEAVALEPEGEPSPVEPGRFFSDAALRAAERQAGRGTRNLVVYMAPEDFLGLARQESVNPDKEAQLSGLFARGEVLREIPSMRIDESGEVTGHDGRHRARALIAAGATSMPVLLESSASSEGVKKHNATSIRWSAQSEPGARNYKDRLPTQLMGQVGSRGEPNPYRIDAPYYTEGARRGEARALVAEPSPAEPAIEAVIEQAETEGGRVPGWRTQVAPPPLPVEAGPDVPAVDVQMEKDALADSIKEVRVAFEEAAAEREVAPRPSGAKIRAVVDKGAGRRRIEEIDTPPAPLSAKDALRRLALLANAATATEADIADAINDYVVAEASAEGEVSAPRNIDNIDRLKQVAAEMGRTDEEIDALLSHQRMSFAQVIDAMDSAGMRTVLAEDGRGVVIPEATAALITRVNNGEYTPTAMDTAAIHSTYRAILRARENILEAVSEPGLNERDMSRPVRAHLQALNKMDAELRVQELDALLAQKRGGTPAARAMRFRQYLMDDVMNMVQAQARATMKKRKPLTDKEIAEIERLWDLAENAETEAVASEKSARAALAKAQKRLKKAEDVLRGAEEVKKGAAKKARKPRKKTPRQEAAKREAEDKPIRVSPIRKSAEQKRLEKEFKAAQKAAAKAADKVQKAKTAVRKAKRDKSEVPDKAIHPWLALYRKAFGGALVLNSSGDNSALGRQALGLAIQNPGAAARTLGVALRAAPWVPGHRDYARRIQEEMLASPYQRLRDAAGVQMTDVEGRSNIEGGPMESREEQWMFRALETGFFGDYLVVPSQNVFGLTLNLLRTATFDEGATMLADIHGLDIDAMAEADLSKLEDGSAEMRFMRDLKGLGLLINVSSGRGTWTGKSLGVARHLMFAPRYTMSRFELPIRALQLAAGKGAFDEVSPQARDLFMKRAGRQVAWSVGVMLMSAISAWANDDDVTDAVDAFFDPEDGDFLKMRIGDYHIDAMQGLGPTWRYVWPFAFSPGRAAEKGDITELFSGREKYGRAYLQLARNKLAPLVSGLMSMYPGIDYRGRFISDLPRSDSTGQRLLEAQREAEEDIGFTPSRPWSPLTSLGAPPRGSKAEGAMATLLDRVIFPVGGMVAPITVQSAASEWLESATDREKGKLQLLIPVALNFFGVGAAHYEDHKKKGKKTKPFSGYFQ